jgi:NAD(P)-dependent dehydrogenase (short-subunit alcohol dehydrogenase family)
VGVILAASASRRSNKIFADSHPSLWWFFNKVKRLWLAALKRRSQTARLSWERVHPVRHPLLSANQNYSPAANISSAAGRLGFAMRTPYAAAKWGVIGLTKSLSIELGPDNIRVNAILLGLVAGDRQRRVLEAKAQQRGISYAELERTAFSYTSIKDYVTSEQIADQILFMCSLRGKTISGQAISICGDTQMLSCGTSRWASGY